MPGIPSSNLGELIEKYAQFQKRAAEQDLKKEFNKLFSLCEEKMQRKDKNWEEKFDKLETDFERVHFYLKHFLTLEEVRKMFKNEAVKSLREQFQKTNGKSDKMSRLFLWLSNRKRDELEPTKSMRFSTLAVFYASTKRQLSFALAQRSIILYENGLLDEAIQDAIRAMEGPLTQGLMVKLRICLGFCYRHKGNYAEANDNFKIALNSIRENHLRGFENLYERISNAVVDQNTPQEISQNIWKFYFPEAPKLSAQEDEGDTEKPCLLLASNGSLRPKKLDAKKCDWSLESTRDINAGEIILVEKAYAASLIKKRTRFCYTCFRHCLNLIPCQHCTHFGFCSEKCRGRSTKVEHPRSAVNNHIYDCNGILPNILSDKFECAQLVYMCIANTDPQKLIDYICRTGVYSEGRGHQAFRGTKKVRRIPPKIFDPSDYSSLAWMSTNSNEIDIKMRLEHTRTAIYLTFCLLIAGYPMNTRGSSWTTKDKPSSKHRPPHIFAGWLAACILYHLQSISITTFFLTERLFYEAGSSMKVEGLEIGLIVYPTISLINHSCDPTALILMSTDGAAGVVAFKPISANSEISICYLFPYWQARRDKRRRRLKEGFSFFCKCEACVRNWRVVKDKNILILYPGCVKGGEELCNASLPSVDFYDKLVHVYLPKIEELKALNDVTSESIAYVTHLVNQIDSFIAPPSDVLKKVKEAYEHLIKLKYSSWTLAPIELVDFNDLH